MKVPGRVRDIVCHRRTMSPATSTARTSVTRLAPLRRCPRSRDLERVNRFLFSGRRGSRPATRPGRTPCLRGTACALLRRAARRVRRRADVIGPALSPEDPGTTTPDSRSPGALSSPWVRRTGRAEEHPRSTRRPPRLRLQGIRTTLAQAHRLERSSRRGLNKPWLHCSGSPSTALPAIPAPVEYGISYMEGGSQNGESRPRRRRRYTGTEKRCGDPRLCRRRQAGHARAAETTRPGSARPRCSTASAWPLASRTSGVLRLLLVDEPRLAGWQSGASGRPDTQGSLPSFQQADLRGERRHRRLHGEGDLVRARTSCRALRMTTHP